MEFPGYKCLLKEGVLDTREVVAQAGSRKCDHFGQLALCLVFVSVEPTLENEHSWADHVYIALTNLQHALVSQLSESFTQRHIISPWQLAHGCGFLHKRGRCVWTASLPQLCHFTPSLFSPSHWLPCFLPQSRINGVVFSHLPSVPMPLLEAQRLL